jgi:quercetin 2,3-dioxygenase
MFCFYKGRAMITVRYSKDRGYADHGWLKSFHSFSFANYYDPQHMGFGNLRVINEDYITAGGGFGTHPHRDMEIVTYVMSGELSHQDSMGNRATVVPSEVQRMSAGTGVTHSEHSHPTVPTHLLQIWLEPSIQGLAPSYEQVAFLDADKRGKLLLVASSGGVNRSVQLNADASIYAGLFDGLESAHTPLNPARKYYVFVAKGRMSVNQKYLLSAGDALLIEQETTLDLTQASNAEVLVFDLRA